MHKSIPPKISETKSLQLKFSTILIWLIRNISSPLKQEIHTDVGDADADADADAAADTAKEGFKLSTGATCQNTQLLGVPHIQIF